MGGDQLNIQQKPGNAHPQHAAGIYAIGQGLRLRFWKWRQGYTLSAVGRIVASHFILDTSNWNVINCNSSSAFRIIMYVPVTISNAKGILLNSET